MKLQHVAAENDQFSKCFIIIVQTIVTSNKNNVIHRPDSPLL